MSPVELKDNTEEVVSDNTSYNARITFGTFVIRVPKPDDGEKNDNPS